MLLRPSLLSFLIIGSTSYSLLYICVFSVYCPLTIEFLRCQALEDALRRAGLAVPTTRLKRRDSIGSMSDVGSAVSMPMRTQPPLPPGPRRSQPPLPPGPPPPLHSASPFNPPLPPSHAPTHVQPPLPSGPPPPSAYPGSTLPLQHKPSTASIQSLNTSYTSQRPSFQPPLPPAHAPTPASMQPPLPRSAPPPLPPTQSKPAGP